MLRCIPRDEQIEIQRYIDTVENDRWIESGFLLVLVKYLIGICLVVWTCIQTNYPPGTLNKYETVQCTVLLFIDAVVV